MKLAKCGTTLAPSMTLPVFTHPACLKHDPGSDHPETSKRLHIVLDRLAGERGVMLTESAPAPREPLLAVHSQAYLATVVSPDSWAAAIGGAGASLAAVDHAMNGKSHAFAAIRPPGHHALAGKGMGFCLSNNVVVAARQAQAGGRSE